MGIAAQVNPLGLIFVGFTLGLIVGLVAPAAWKRLNNWVQKRLKKL